MRILAIETSGVACSVALMCEGNMRQKHEIRANQHSQLVLMFVDQILKESSLKFCDLDAIAVGNGPGSFTGLRLAVGVAQGLAYGIHKPLIPISSLAGIASQSDQKNLIVAVDARMGDVYWQCFKRDVIQGIVAYDGARLDKPKNIRLPKITSQWHGMGSGWDIYHKQLSGLLNDDDHWTRAVLPNAEAIARLAKLELEQGWGETQEQTLPIYIRNKVTG